MQNKKFLIIIIIILSLYSCDDEPNRSPSITITSDVTTGTCPLTVNFTADATDPDGNSLTYAWDFGDNTGTSTEQNPTYVYNSVGVFTVTCTVTDNGSPQKSAMATLIITTEANIPVLTSLSPSWKVTHMPTFTLTLTGSSFVSGAKVFFKGIEKNPTFVDSGTLEVTILPNDTLVDSYTYIGDAVSSTAVQVSVTNPEPGGGNSDPLDFQIYSNHRFTEPEQVAEGIYTTFGPTIGIKRIDNRIYLGWRSGTYISQTVGMIKYSDDDGVTWSSDIEIPFYFSFPFSTLHIPDSSGLLYSMYDADSIAFTKSNDTGATWSDPITLFTHTTYDGVYDYDTTGLIIFRAPGGILCACFRVYKHNEDGFYGYTNYLTRSSDEGVTWNEPEIVFSYPEDGYTVPRSWLIDTTGRIFVIFDLGIHPQSMRFGYFTYSDDDGATWSSRGNINPPSGMDIGYTFLFPNNSFGLLGIERSGNDKTLLLYRKSQGTTEWTKLPDIVTHTGYLTKPAKAIDSAGNINLIYSTGTDYYTDRRIYYLRSIDGGWTWSNPISFSSTEIDAGTGSITIDNEGNLFIVYQTTTNPYIGYFIKSIK